MNRKLNVLFYPFCQKAEGLVVSASGKNLIAGSAKNPEQAIAILEDDNLKPQVVIIMPKESDRRWLGVLKTAVSKEIPIVGILTTRVDFDSDSSVERTRMVMLSSRCKKWCENPTNPTIASWHWSAIFSHLLTPPKN